MNPASRRPLVAGNWKMHGTVAEARRLIGELRERGVGNRRSEAVVCPPFVHLAEARRQLEGGRIGLGAQDVCAEEQGAYTGEVSAAMLADAGCQYVIVGHSERRALYGESDGLVARKFLATGRHGLVPILCVGETLAEREQEATRAVVLRQLDAVLDAAGAAAFARAVVAYEPVWAIGTGKTPTVPEVEAAHTHIRAVLGGLMADAGNVRILYGGSMKPANAAELLAVADVDGGLIGGASLKAADFLAIAKSAKP